MSGDRRLQPTTNSFNSADNQIQNSPDRQQLFHAAVSPRFYQVEVPAHTGASPTSSSASVLSLPLYNFTTSVFDLGIKSEDLDLSMLSGNNPMMQQQHQQQQQQQQQHWSPQSSNLHNLTPARPAGRSAAFSHNRDSSISSIGSAGPVSPYSQTSANPQIVLNESLSNDAVVNAMSSFYEEQSYPMAKQASSSTNDSFYGQGASFQTPDGLPIAPSANVYGNLMVVPPHGTSRSQPVSATSSIASNSPATPMLDCADDDSRRRNGLTGVPNKAADRSVSDYFGDEMYKSAGFALPTSAPMGQHMSQSAGQQQFAASVHNSPAHTGPSQEFTSSPRNNHLRFSSAPLLAERGAAQPGGPGHSTPHTISPKDAMLEYREQDSEANAANYSLFAQRNQQAQFAAANQMNQTFPTMPAAAVTSSPVVYNNYLAPQMAPNMQQQLQNYPFVSQQQQPLPQPVPNRALNTARPGVPVPRTIASLDMLSQPVPGSQRPGIDTSDGGTYTCTYHGCSQRFDSPSALQKHKREGHRQMHAMTTARRPDSSSGGPVNTQLGPHVCERTNPSTGKPCNTVFSRPYDLTRHEDTIHNARKQKVRCKLCIEEKTFSRADALTRHFRVCHPEVEFQGKHKKRRHGSRAN